tara:strand:- start:4365 stop:5468 length:1104 start_codon:yes stop_codon:yes gene_type:complete
MTEIKKTALRLKKPPRNSEDDPEKEGKKRKIDEVYAILEIEEEKGKLKELNLVQQLTKLEEIHENNKKLEEICERDGILLSDGTNKPVYWKMINDGVAIFSLCDTVEECISMEKKEIERRSEKLQLIEQRFEKLLVKINKEDPEHVRSLFQSSANWIGSGDEDPEIHDDDETHPASASIDLTDTDDTDKDTLEELKKRVTDAEFKLTRFIDIFERDEQTTHFGMEKLSGRVDDLSKSVKDLEEWKNAAGSFTFLAASMVEPKKAPEEGQVQDKRPGSRIQNRWEIHAGRDVWVYSKTQRKPGVIKKVNIVKAIVTMANAGGKMTDYDVPFGLIGLRDESRNFTTVEHNKPIAKADFELGGVDHLPNF